MEEENKGRTFVFYPQWLRYVEKLSSPEDKYEMIKMILDYGCYNTYEIKDEVLGTTFEVFIKEEIDKAQKNYLEKVDYGKTNGRKRLAVEDKIAELVKQGKNGKEIADELGVTASAVYKTDAWKNRKGNQEEVQQNFDAGFTF